MRPRAAILLLTIAIAVTPPPLRAQGQSAQDESPANRKVLNRVVPAYPDLARRMNLGGTVRVEAVVAPNGTLKSTHVIGGSPVLTKAAVDAIAKWKWAEAPQESKELIELNFHPE